MKFNKLPSKEKLNKKYEYKDGRLYKRSNGKEIGTMSNGYVSTEMEDVNGIRKNFKVHRIIWSMFNGDIPDGMVIDHNDGNQLNNKIDNLILRTSSQNLRNTVRHRTGNLGMLYIQKNTSGGYTVRIPVKEKETVYFGTYSTLDNAEIARDNIYNYLFKS